MPYNVGATKAMKAMQKQYGSNWAHVYYGLANKRSGKGLRGKHRGHKAANKAYAKGSHWGGKRKARRSTSSRRGTGHRVTVRTRGKARVNHRSGGTRIRVHVK